MYYTHQQPGQPQVSQAPRQPINQMQNHSFQVSAPQPQAYTKREKKGLFFIVISHAQMVYV